MDIPPTITKCVVFIGYKPHNSSEKLAGTGFMLFQRLEAPRVYVATARHVIDGIGNRGLDSVYLRLDRKSNGPAWVKTALHDWRTHQDGKIVDVSILDFAWDEPWDHEPYPIAKDAQATNEIIQEYQIGVGNEVLVAGLFHPHHGKQNNIPIVRVGTIAAMTTETVATELGPIVAYLIDTRSIRGLSGSRVFVALGTTRTVSGLPMTTFQRFFLLGLVHGHYKLSTEPLNLGIEIVVPVGKIAQVIEQPANPTNEPAHTGEKRAPAPAAIPAVTLFDYLAQSRLWLRTVDHEITIRWSLGRTEGLKKPAMVALQLGSADDEHAPTKHCSKPRVR